MKNLQLFTVIASMALLTLFSCESMLQVEEKSTINLEVATATVRAQEAIILHCYHSLQTSDMYGRMMTIAPDLLGDQTYITSVNNATYLSLSNNVAGNHINNWTFSYDIIVKANIVISTIDEVEMTGEDPNQRDWVKAEALFFRAFSHFDLARVYGFEPLRAVERSFLYSIPIMDRPFIYEGGEIPAFLFPPRNTVEEVYTFVENDLNMAFSLMENNPIDTQSPWRISKYAIKSLLARLYLYWEKYPQAIEAATYVINNSGISLHNGLYRDVFSQSLETVFGLYYNITEALGDNALQIFTSRVETGNRDELGRENPINGRGNGNVGISPNLVASFEEGDTRRALIRWVLKGAEDVYWTDKYAGYGGFVGQDNIPIIRIPELYMIRAESYACLQAPNISAAINDVNALRISRNLSAIDPSPLTAQDALDIVESECIKEFICEGHRFYDLKRKGHGFVKATNSGAPGANILPTDYRLLARIPPSQIDINPNLLPQNPGL